MFKLLEFKDNQTSAKELSKTLSALLKEKLQKQALVRLALSGGRSPISFFEFFQKENLEWQKVHFSLVDERITPKDSENSNENLLKSYFFKDALSKPNFTPLLENLANFDEVDENKLLHFANSKFIQPDFALLGMGSDGHSASLFFDAPEFQKAIKSEQNIVFLSPKKAPFKRLSMSLKALEACKKLFLFISGEEKIKTLEKALLKEDESLPISLILHSKKVQLYVYFSR
ncbi:6-phosphogluconolactonase [Campylobacter sp. MIT 99-7217]|uniref:6-phosphogluconolactonase n=1 Tax=Campylobacter sp. MIT 99-7217 TaxID=535091 RepID=UPI00115A0CC5|nr:6-phosphogluconolactonase [Campylobacter sp. MIT 99-7217]TQR32317.1 6-phosphogluconolactonase [Campylobacter sp. MIT 99-7217]